MSRSNRIFQFGVLVLLLLSSSCNTAISASSVPMSVTTGAEPSTVLIPSQTLISTPSPISPEALFTPTPDPNLFTVSTEIEQQSSREEIARVLYTNWLNHFQSKNVSPEMRLESFVINNINIPSDQKCAGKLGGAFIAEAEITAETTLPLYSTTSYERSNWFVAGGGNILDSYHQFRLFSGLIYKAGNKYTLVVITQVPMCN